jgi:hypothetical protein
MNVTGVTALSNFLQTGSNANLYLDSGNAFSDKLALGQIIQGRVMRQYEGDRYLVSFGGQEKVVDSAVPLKTNEIIFGKVVGLGDRVELERVRTVQTSTDGVVAVDKAIGQAGNQWNTRDKSAKLVGDLFDQYRGNLPADQLVVLEQLSRNTKEPALMALSGLVLSKLNLPINPELAKSLYRVLQQDAHTALFSLGKNTLELETATFASNAQDNTEFLEKELISLLAKGLQELVENFSERDAKEKIDSATYREVSKQVEGLQDADDRLAQGNDHEHEYDLARWVLNAQTGASVGHQINTIPLILNNRLLELNIALFDQRDSEQSKQQTRHRKVVFSFDCESLGHLEINSTVTGTHIKLAIGSDSTESAEILLRHNTSLREKLTNDGWTIDELKYEAQSSNTSNVTQSLLQHIITQNSISRLI